jgi:hypothetical protein
MLRILGTQKTLCDGLSRRDLLRVGTLGFLGLGDWLRLRAGEPPGLARRSGARFGQAKSCILLFLFGSPSQHDTFDPKPEAPDEVRGELKPIQTSVPGTQICELLPQIARLGDRTTIVRSLAHPYPIHGIAYAITGTPILSEAMQLNPRDTRHWPFIGSVVQYLDERQNRREPEVPRNICMPWLVSSRRGHPSRDAGPYGHFLGSNYDPVWTEFQGEATRELNYFREPYRDPYAGITPESRLPLGASDTLPEGITLGRLTDRQELLRQFDLAARTVERQEAVRNFDKHQQRAFSLMMTSKTREALDIAREPLALRQRYGMHLFGQATLAARRLIEAGSRFATVFWDDYHHLQSAWDTHNWHFPKMRELLCPGLDQTVAALLEDLEARGLLDETLVVCMSEHGRTPKLDSGPRIHGGGRGHWSLAYSMLLAGGGFARGKVVGRTDRIGGEVSDTPISPKDILATMYYLLGIAPHTTIPDRLGRPIAIAGEGRVREELLA